MNAPGRAARRGRQEAHSEKRLYRAGGAGNLGARADREDPPTPITALQASLKAEMSDDDAPSLAELTTRIVTAYFRSHDLAAADVGRLVTTVGTELGSLGRPPEQPAAAEPAVPIEDSVRRDGLVCLVCGRRMKTLRRHLLSAHGLTAGDYRERYALDRDYPMVAAASSARRAEIARRTGLGLRTAVEPVPAPAVPVPQAPEPAPEQPKRRLGVKPIRGRRAAKPAGTEDPARQPQPEPAPEPKRPPGAGGSST
jgi:predicted transcriptional regulator